MKDENAMQLDAHVTDVLTKPSLACPLAIQRLVISNRIMRPQLTPHYGRLLRCTSHLYILHLPTLPSHHKSANFCQPS